MTGIAAFLKARAPSRLRIVMRPLSIRLASLWRRHPDTGLAIGLGALVVLLLAVTAQTGFVRDEGYYFRAAREYHAWFEGLWQKPSDSFSDAVLTRAFGYNTEHPGFVKILMGFTWKLFHGWLGVTGNALGFRLASMLMVGVGAAFLYLLGARRFDRPTGVLAVALLFACPHVFYHSHLACFDGPIMALAVVCAYAFHESLTARRWVLYAGLAFGVALATKHNAVFFPATLLAAYFIGNRSAFGIRGGLTFPPLPLSLFAMAVLGPLVLYVFYPYGWHAPLERLGAYYAYHAHHEHYPVDFLGTLYREPPFPPYFPFVMSALTIPVPILFAGLGGFFALLMRALRRAPSEPNHVLDWIIVLSIVVPPSIIAMPNVPIFGGTKHWMTMMPFFCLCAAWTIMSAARALPKRRLAPLVIGVALILPIAETMRSHPLQQAYFNELAGGHQGAAALGMPRTFWGGDGGLLLSRLNDLAAPNATVFTHRMNQDDFRAYQADGLLRQDLRFTTEIDRADWALTYYQREYQEAEYAAWQRLTDRRPTSVIEYDGVPLVSLYDLTRD